MSRAFRRSWSTHYPFLGECMTSGNRDDVIVTAVMTMIVAFILAVVVWLRDLRNFVSSPDSRAGAIAEQHRTAVPLPTTMTVAAGSSSTLSFQRRTPVVRSPSRTAASCVSRRIWPLFEPCRRVVCCQTCAERIISMEGGPKCPKCRAYIGTLTVSFFNTEQLLLVILCGSTKWSTPEYWERPTVTSRK